jgi:SAM-dependent methyltransferase
MGDEAGAAGVPEDDTGLADWMTAVAELTPGLNASGVLALLVGLGRSGQLPSALSEGLPEGSPAVHMAMQAALEAAGATGGRAGAWHTVLAGEGLVPPEALLSACSARNRLLEALAEGDDYWRADPELRRGIAQGVSPDPRLPASLVAMGSMVQALPEWQRRAHAGARYLELGCGLAGGMLAELQMFPAMTATGVELAADLVAEAQARAEQVGVAERVEFVVGDATRFDRPDSYDLCFWSQFFFPSATRAAALAAAARCLRPGGMLGAPVRARPDADASSDEVLDYLLDNVLFSSWGIPERSADELVDEVAAAGFVEVTVVSEPPWMVVQAFKP